MSQVLSAFGRNLPQQLSWLSVSQECPHLGIMSSRLHNYNGVRFCGGQTVKLILVALRAKTGQVPRNALTGNDRSPATAALPTVDIRRVLQFQVIASDVDLPNRKEISRIVRDEITRMDLNGVCPMPMCGFFILLFVLSASPLSQPQQTHPRFPLHVESLEYPILARQARIEGDVVINASVDPLGRSIISEVVTGHPLLVQPLLVQPALDNLRKWRFPSGDWETLTVTYHFKVEGKPTRGPAPTKCEFDLPDSVTIMVQPPIPETD